MIVWMSLSHQSTNVQFARLFVRMCYAEVSIAGRIKGSDDTILMRSGLNNTGIGVLEI